MASHALNSADFINAERQGTEYYGRLESLEDSAVLLALEAA
jgi:hypothetical protein